MFAIEVDRNGTNCSIVLFIYSTGLTEHAPIECGGRSLCPHPCRCAEGIVDCREKSLSNVPSVLPEDTTEL